MRNFAAIERLLAGSAAVLIFGMIVATVIMGFVKSDHASSATAAPAPPSRTAFLHETPWQDNKKLGPETFEVLIAMINSTRYYCPQLLESDGARAMGIGTFGRQIYVWCTTGLFRISFRPDSDQYTVSPL